MTRRTTSAGVLLWRRRAEVEFFLVHPGGPFWARRDAGAWGIPKGEVGAEEESLAAAKRELFEETGVELPSDAVLTALESVRMKSGKRVYAWLVEGDADETRIVSNTVEVEWPPRSGKVITIPEVDRAGWFPLAEAVVKILPGQAPLLEEAARVIAKAR